MATDVLVMDTKAAELLSSSAIDGSWFEGFPIPPGANLRRICIGRTVYILSKNVSEDSSLFICNVRSDGIGGKNDAEVPFSRALRMALAANGNKTVGIPRNFKLHKEGALSSIYAYHYNMNDPSRICFRKSGDHLFLYAMTEDVVDFSKIDEPRAMYDTAISSFEDALLRYWEIRDEPDLRSYGIVFEDNIGKTYSQSGLTIEDWCARELTAQQLKFVNAPLNTPIRLRGSAGTGKTQCMVIKCLKELFESEDKGQPIRIAFITHSSGVAHEVVEGMMCSLDPKNRRNAENTKSTLWVGSLYELAREKLGYDSKDIVPLSLDGAAGRKAQEGLLKDCVSDSLHEGGFRKVLSNCSDYIRSGLTATPMDSLFLRELSNEVACSLDSEGVRKSNKEKAKEYLKGTRQPWQMKLDREEDRRAILDIHEKYASLLVDTDTINLDQMISDLYGYLNSHEWSMFRRSGGFDIIFIDELHYFNRYERLVFHLLVRESANQGGRMPLFMAYDMKQGTDDRSLSSPGGVGRFFKSIHAGQSELVELTQVFRSTPQIARFLEHIDRAFPALDLEDEWQTYAGVGKQKEGHVPNLLLFDTLTSMLDGIIKEAHRFAKQEGGKKVAVLCMSDDYFIRFSNAGRIRRSISVVESNTDLTPIRNAKKRCIFSMPENVAGLQFDRVYVINVDKQELDDAALSVGAKRQALSRLYLAASRASRYLTLAASEDCGGYSDVLKNPLEVGVLQLIS